MARVGAFALVACIVITGQELNFDDAVPSEILHQYYSFGAARLLHFRGHALANGVRIIVYGTLEGRSFDSKGAFVEMAGTPNQGVIHVYMALREFDKLQSSSYVNESLLRPGNREIGVEAALVGLNEYGNLEMRNGTILPWASVLLPHERVKIPSTPPVIAQKSLQPAQKEAKSSDFFRYPGNHIETAATSIRDIDFANFAYPWTTWVNSKLASTRLQLHSGQSVKQQGIQEDVKLAEVTYGDVTGDGVDDAIVRLNVRPNGPTQDRAWMSSTFIYTLRPGFAVLLAEFDSGFTLRRVGVLNGDLVIETDEIGDLGMCCPVAVVESHYKWVSGRFIRTETKRRQLR